MAWIEIIDEEDAEGRLADEYAHVGGAPVDNILKIHSLNPKSLRTHYDLYAHLMRGPSPLSRAEREMIAVVVSKTNQCHY